MAVPHPPEGRSAICAHQAWCVGHRWSPKIQLGRRDGVLKRVPRNAGSGRGWAHPQRGRIRRCGYPNFQAKRLGPSGPWKRGLSGPTSSPTLSSPFPWLVCFPFLGDQYHRELSASIGRRSRGGILRSTRRVVADGSTDHPRGQEAGSPDGSSPAIQTLTRLPPNAGTVGWLLGVRPPPPLQGCLIGWMSSFRWVDNGRVNEGSGTSFSEDGAWWWSGSQWLPTVTSDGRWRWNGFVWLQIISREQPPKWLIFSGVAWLVLLGAWIPALVWLHDQHASSGVLIEVGAVLGGLAVLASLGFGALLGFAGLWKRAALASLFGAGVLIFWYSAITLAAPDPTNQNDHAAGAGAVILGIPSLVLVALLLFAGGASGRLIRFASDRRRPTA